MPYNAFGEPGIVVSLWKGYRISRYNSTAAVFLRSFISYAKGTQDYKRQVLIPGAREGY
jgi:hypothetical protein